MNAIIAVIVMILSLIGLTEIFKQLVMFLICRNSDEEIFINIIPLRGKCEDVERRVRSSVIWSKWNGKKQIKTICLDLNADDETRAVCEKIAQDYTFVTLAKYDTFGIEDIF